MCLESLVIFSASTGQDFIASNVDLVMNNEKLTSPVGFDVIFPSLIENAIDMNVNLHISPTDIDALLRLQDLELKRYVCYSVLYENRYNFS